MPTKTVTLDRAAVEAEIQRRGRSIWSRIADEKPGLFDRNYWQGRLLEWAMRDESFKVDMFRLVDVLPVLDSPAEVARHVREYLLKEGRELPGLLTAALKAASSGLTAGLGAAAIRKNVGDMAGRFIAGRDAREALPALKALHRDGFAFTVDLLGEAVLSTREADVYQSRYLELIESLTAEAPRWPACEPLLDGDARGPLPRVNVSLKVTAMHPHLDAADVDGSVERLLERVRPIALQARERGAFLNLDMEQWAVHEITMRLFEALATAPGLSDWPHLGIAVQAYLRSARADVERLLALARRRGAPLTVRLVKGAYWDYEFVLARQRAVACPVFTRKADTDANFEALSRLLLEHHDVLTPAIASHNLRSLVHALTLAELMGVPRPAFEIQMLYGMAEPERRAIRTEGVRVRLYVPIGALLPGMAYLVRRLLENTSNEGFLRLSHHEGADIARLLRSPAEIEGEDCFAQQLIPRMKRGELETPFENCPPTDFTDGEARAAFAAAVAQAGDSLPRRVPVVVGGRELTTGAGEQRPCPADLNRPCVEVNWAGVEHVEQAVNAAWAAWPEWRDRPLRERAAVLERLADLLERDRLSLAALQCHEVAKPWAEADADVAEAVDFCRYYARQALVELDRRRLGDRPGEDNVLFYEGRGPCAVIAPWNFPLAIPAGMTAAALVAGNTVVLKPAEQSSATGYELYRRLLIAGVPPEAVHFLPGRGEVVGASLVAHPLIAQIAFTGSMAVGLGIIERAARTSPSAPQIKRVVCEMGGKNAIVIDSDADLDEAVAGVVRSAFGYAGQKCSACSRVIVVGRADAFRARLVDAVRSLRLAPASDPACQLPPVIDKESCDRLAALITGFQHDPALETLFIGERPADLPPGYYVPPAVFEVSDPHHAIMQEEFFGPILALMSVDSFDQALKIAAGTRYALTGAVYSRSPERLAQARRAFRVGNLYLNRGSTGALVQRQPFGGFGMSGLGTKAGGPGYLLHFADPRTVTENTMRRGFTPEVNL
ncbi:MAG: proline dehydrogenase family protein [Candidatus Sumerlaeia bacterium]